MNVQPKITLYDYWRSSASYRVRIALNLKGLPYEKIKVDLLHGEHLGDAYKNINPQGFVPFLKIDDLGLGQSLAMIEYLEDIYPDVPLLGTNAQEKAYIRQISHVIASDTAPIAVLHVLKKITEVTGDDDAKKQWASHFIRKGLQSAEAYLQQTSGIYSVGDTVSMADCCLIPQLYNAQRWNADYSDLSNILKIEENCSKLEAFKNAYPSE